MTAKGPEGQRVWRPNVVISAVGLLSRPSIPEIDGAGDFRGLSFHTARWPQDLDLDGLRIGVIGTGCSGIQLVPELAPLTGHVIVFQRSPQWLFDRKGYREPYPPQVTWLDQNFPYFRNFMRFRAQWLMGPYLSGPLREVDPTFDHPHARSAVNKRLRDERVAFIERKFETQPDLIERMIPSFPPYARRPVQVDSDYCYYDALLRDDVTLVTDRIDRITPSGIRTFDGTEYELDVIVFATGFRANECLWPMDVRGRDDRSIEELWSKDGPRAYLGTMAPGVPELLHDLRTEHERVRWPRRAQPGGDGGPVHARVRGTPPPERSTVGGRDRGRVLAVERTPGRARELPDLHGSQSEELLPERARSLGDELPLLRHGNVALAPKPVIGGPDRPVGRTTSADVVPGRGAAWLGPPLEHPPGISVRPARR